MHSNKNNLTLNSLHHDAKRMEYFLNSVKEPLTETPLDWHSWQLAENIEDGFSFVSNTADPVTITALLCSSYNDANKIAKATTLTALPTAKWTVNGALLYFVESADAKKVSAILSLFAGEE